MWCLFTRCMFFVLAIPHATLLYWFSMSQIHAHMQLLKPVHYTETNITFLPLLHVQGFQTFHASHGELFHTQLFYIGIDQQGEQVPWNNYTWGSIISFISSNSSSDSSSINTSSCLVWLKWFWICSSDVTFHFKGLNWLEQAKFTDNSLLISNLSKNNNLALRKHDDKPWLPPNKKYFQTICHCWH